MSFDPLLPKHQRRRIAYGGNKIKGSRKIKRPLHPRYPVHLVLKSSLAEGDRSFLKPSNARFIAAELTRITQAHHLKLIEWENVGNHLHLVLRFKDSKNVGKFLKVFCARISMRMLGTKKGTDTEAALKAQGLKVETRVGVTVAATSSSGISPTTKMSAAQESKARRFWDGTPFSRVVFERLKEGFGLMTYLRKNSYERMGWDAKTAAYLAKELPPEIVFGPPDIVYEAPR